MTTRVKKIESLPTETQRRNRAASLALPNNSLIDLLDDQVNTLNCGPLLQAESLSPTNSSGRRHSSACQPMVDEEVLKVKERKPPNRLTLAPPPVPKRTFQGKIFKISGKDQSKSTEYPKQTQSPSHVATNYSKIHSKNQSAQASNNSNANKKSNTSDCMTDLCSISFDDIGDSDDLVIFDKKMQSIDSNQSSSDSNRSQTTIDTGYISAFETDRSCMTNKQRQFRSRFSSEDTQSSLDSYLSSDLQRADTVDSLQSNFTDSPFVMKKSMNIFSFDQNRLNSKISSSGSIDSDNKSITPIKTHAMRRLPAVPARKGMRQRGAPPPTPPSRASNNNIDSVHKSSGRNKESIHELQNRPPMSVNGKRPPPLTQIHHTKINQRQDSNISSDSYSLMSSPGYNTKNMEVPLLQNASKINKSKNIHHQNSTDSFIMSNINRNVHHITNKVNLRQDSNISSDSFSQTSSPGYNSKLMDAPLLAHAVKLHAFNKSYKNNEEIAKETNSDHNTNAITKSASTPASLQTIVRFSNGSNMSLQHKILRARKNSNPYVTRGRLKFRLCQILLNALALLIIAGGLAGYFHAYPTIKFVNKTISVPQTYESQMSTNDRQNPAPGVCLPVIVKFCQLHKLPYNYTVFPNYIGHFGQLEAQVELDAFDALVDVQCYELVPLFLCSLFVPKCSSIGKPVPPCRALCIETIRRCGFFFDVFGLELPEYLTCKLFSDSTNPDECVGNKEMRELKTRKPVCNEFMCDKKRCIPSDWVCDGHVDCLDQTDELHCKPCNSSSIHCGEKRCMSDKHICDGVVNCPFGQDERNCIRLSDRNGDFGRGTLEVYKADKKQWAPACARNWDPKQSPSQVCSMLGYSSVNASQLLRGLNSTIHLDPTSVMRMSQRKVSTLLKGYTSCNEKSGYPVAELTCTNFECGRVRTKRRRLPQARIIGGTESKPGDWPFLAAILGGPEEIFYCAGVLIADQWVLTASHCIGNHTLRNLNDWTIQLGMTRRHSHTHYGQKIKVKSVIPHPQYNYYVAHDNDIALFQLATRVAFHDHLLPVCLPPQHLKELNPGTNCTVIGWGKREDKNSNPNAQNTAYEPAINEVTVPVLNRDLCNEWLEMLNVTEGMICAGYAEGGKDACQGDSGGPLLCPYPDDKDRWYVGGIVSWGIMCAHPRLPGVYANVPKYIPWIKEQIKKHSTPSNGR